MKSQTLASFWEAYRNLDEPARQNARRAYRLWIDNPFHPSLRFKCINPAERVWSVRIGRGVRALGVLEGDQVTWSWIGGHDQYDRRTRG